MRRLRQLTRCLKLATDRRFRQGCRSSTARLHRCTTPWAALEPLEPRVLLSGEAYFDRDDFLAQIGVSERIEIGFEPDDVHGPFTPGQTINFEQLGPPQTPVVFNTSEVGLEILDLNDPKISLAFTPTSGSQVVSPFGTADAIENEPDDIFVMFDAGTHAFGLDIIFDGNFQGAVIDVEIFDTSFKFIDAVTLEGFELGNPSTQFVGYICDCDIGSFEIQDFEEDDPRNLAYDSLVYAPPGSDITYISPVSYDMENGDVFFLFVEDHTGDVFNLEVPFLDEDYSTGNGFSDREPLTGGVGQLTDGILGQSPLLVVDGFDGQIVEDNTYDWVGWEFEGPQIVFDLGQTVQLASVGFHTLVDQIQTPSSLDFFRFIRFLHR